MKAAEHILILVTFESFNKITLSHFRFFSLQEIASRIGSQHSSGWKGLGEGCSPSSSIKQSAFGLDWVA